MIGRIKQGFNYLTAKAKEEDLKFAYSFLNEEEKEIFSQMGEYDKYHSINVLRGVLEDEILKNSFTYQKLALLHDCGKENIGLLPRVKKVVLKGDEKVDAHPKRSFEKLFEIDPDLAILAKEHQNKNTDIPKLKRFQMIDDMN